MVLQVATAVLSGTTSYRRNHKEVSAEEWRQREIDVTCWCDMIAHISAFAAIHVCLFLQSEEFFVRSPLHAICVAPIIWVFVVTTFSCTAAARKWIIDIDGKRSHSEHIWDEVSTEAGHDITALALSFTFANTMQFCVFGSLPEAEELLITGPIPRPLLITDMYVTMGSAICLAIIMLLSVKHVDGIMHGKWGRHAVVFIETIAFCFVWALLAFCKLGALYVYPTIELEGIGAKIGLSLVVTACAIGVTIMLDKVADTAKSVGCSKEMHEAIVKVILSLGVLVGFTWESAFLCAVQNISCGPVNTLLISVALCAIVIPAYWNHIEPKIHQARIDCGRALFHSCHGEH